MAIGEPFNVSRFCDDIHEVEPDVVINWGPTTRDGASITVCDACDPRFLPTLWGRPWDDQVLATLPDDEAPWAIALENEPNWWGFVPLTNDHGQGSNLTAPAAAARWAAHKKLVETKWGPGLTKWIAPSPVTDLYKPCRPGQKDGCTWQGQFEWLDEYFAHCDGCLQDMWALSAHEYSCNMDATKQHITALSQKYSKPVFVGELGCSGPSADEQGQYLQAFVAWASKEESVLGYVWCGLNDVGAKNAQLMVDGKLTAVGTAYKKAQGG